MLEKETIIYLKDFRFPRKENRMPEKWEKQTVPKQETVHTDEKYERQWEARADKPRTTNC